MSSLPVQPARHPSGALEYRRPSAGWRDVAHAYYSAKQLRVPILLTVSFTAMAPIWLRPDVGAFHAEIPLAQFVAEPGYATIHSQSLLPDTDPFPWVAWQRADGLLWTAAQIAFGPELATWMRPADTYTLQQWPDLGAVQASAEDQRIAAMLAREYLSVEQIALLAAVSVPAAQLALTRLSLLGVAKAAGGPLLPPMLSPEEVARFQRAA